MTINKNFSPIRRIAYTKLSRFNTSTIILIVAVSMGLSLMFANTFKTVFNLDFSAYELVIVNFQQSLLILFIYVFAFLIISSRFFNKKDKWEYSVMLRSASLKQWFFGQLLYIFICCAFLLILQFITDTFSACMYNGFSTGLSNNYHDWVYHFDIMPQHFIAKTSPLALMLIVQSLMLLRYFFWAAIIFSVSSRTKRTYLGGIVVIIISGIEWIFYTILEKLVNTQHSLYILPIEHNLLTPIVVSNIASPERINIGFSYLYWIVLISILVFLTWRNIKASD